MQISPINYKINPTFQAVNQKYLERAQKEFCKKGGTIGNILDCLSFDVYIKNLTSKDAVETIEAIKNVANKTTPYIEQVLEHFKKNLKEESNQ